MYLQFHSVKDRERERERGLFAKQAYQKGNRETIKNHDIWVRVLFCSVLGKTRVLFRFVLAGFGFFPSLVRTALPAYESRRRRRGGRAAGRSWDRSRANRQMCGAACLVFANRHSSIHMKAAAQPSLHVCPLTNADGARLSAHQPAC